MDGWIKLYRKIAENPLYFAEPFTRMQAWIDMLIIANYEESFIYVRGNKIQIKRGQIGKSQDTLAERWKWSRGKVTRFLDELQKAQQITQQKGHQTVQQKAQQTNDRSTNRKYNKQYNRSTNRRTLIRRIRII